MARQVAWSGCFLSLCTDPIPSNSSNPRRVPTHYRYRSFVRPAAMATEGENKEEVKVRFCLPSLYLVTAPVLVPLRTYARRHAHLPPAAAHPSVRLWHHIRRWDRLCRFHWR